MSFLGELKRRNVIRVGLAYVVAGWLLVQVLEIAADSFEAPPWVMKFAITVIAVGLLPTLIFSWVYEITPEGIKREVEVDRGESITAATGQKLNIAVIVLLVLAIGLFAADRFLIDRHAAPPAQVAVPAEPVPPEEASTAGAPDSAAVAESTPVTPAAAIPAEREASVAVLPFTTRSANDDDRYFSDGVHDDLLTQLAKIGSLKVISRTSVMDYRDTTKRIPDIAGELGVATIVEGAVQRSGSKVRITAQLIDAQTDEHLWAESYDRELTAENLFDIQTEIATSIAGALQATLSPEEQAALQRRLTDDLPAREAYQRAKWLLFSLKTDSIRQAQRELEFALDRDPDFAAAWAQLAQVHLANYWWAIDRSEDRLAKARAAIDKGRALDADLPELDVAEGYYYYWGFRDYERALDLLEPARAKAPNDAELQKLIGFVNRRYGRFELAVEQLERGLELDPRSAVVMTELANTLIRLGRYDRAEGYLDQLRRTHPDDPQQYWVEAALALERDADPAAAAGAWRNSGAGLLFGVASRWEAELSAGDFAAAAVTARELEAIEGAGGAPAGYATSMTVYLSGDEQAARPAMEQAVAKLDPESELVTGAEISTGQYRCDLLGALGDRDGARSACNRIVDSAPPDAFNQALLQMAAAGGMAMAGLNDEAFAVLFEAVEGPVGIRRNVILLEPRLDRLHDDPRWERLVAEAQP